MAHASPVKVTDDGITIPVAKGKVISLPRGTFLPLIGGENDRPIRMLKTIERIVLADRIIEQGSYSWFNHDIGLFCWSGSNHEAELAFAHTNSGYGLGDVFVGGGEERWLETAEAEFLATADLLANWKGLSSEKRERMSRKIAELIDVEGMHSPRNEHKIRVRWYASGSLGFRDSLGRVNPGASERKLHEAAKAVPKRRRQIQWIARHTDGRMVVVRQQRNAHMSLARVAHKNLSLTHDEWGNFGTEMIRVRIARDIEGLKSAVDVPWRGLFRRCVEDDLELAIRFAGGESGIKYVDRARIAIELLEFYPVLADIDVRLTTLLDQHPRHPERKKLKQERLAQLQVELKYCIRQLPVVIENGRVRPGVDRFFRSAITPKLHKRLTRADVAWTANDGSRESWDKVKEHLRDALAAFG